MHRAISSQQRVRAGAASRRHNLRAQEARGRMVQGHSAAHWKDRTLPGQLRRNLLIVPRRDQHLTWFTG